jgi:2'-5' RNA ligase
LGPILEYLQSVKEQIYFVAIVPGDSICEEITAFKQQLAARYGTRHALRTVPHITLKAPFKVIVEFETAVMNWFDQMPLFVQPFEQQLENFGHFDNPRNPVIFIKPVLNKSLVQLQKEILQNFVQAFPSLPLMKNELDFHPHITIGYRDLSYPQFQKAWREFEAKKYERAFVVNNVCLLKHRQKWEVISIRHL